jgi:hypothetical protein
MVDDVVCIPIKTTLHSTEVSKQTDYSNFFLDLFDKSAGITSPETQNAVGYIIHLFAETLN